MYYDKDQGHARAVWPWPYNLNWYHRHIKVQGAYSAFNQTACHFLSQCLDRTVFVFIVVQSLWTLACLSKFLMSSILKNFRATLCFNSPWWRHRKELCSALMPFCAGNSSVTGEFPAQRSVTRSCDVFFDLRLDQQLSKQWRRRWFDTPSRSLWRHCYGQVRKFMIPHEVSSAAKLLLRSFDLHIVPGVNLPLRFSQHFCQNVIKLGVLFRLVPEKYRK